MDGRRVRTGGPVSPASCCLPVGDGQAIAAYRHYLALRSDPEPSLRPEADQVRSELTAPVAEPR